MTSRILVWDLPTRLFHWTLALSFLIAYVTGENERWALLHNTAGYTLLGLIGFRLIWGWVGTRYARFGQFVTGLHTVQRYLAGLLQGQSAAYVGHNPAGALAILALLALGLLCGISGWLLYAQVGGEWLEEVHETAAAVMLAVVVIHIAGVLIMSRRYRQNLVTGMLTGRKSGPPAAAIPGSRPLVALLLLILLAGFWGWSFVSANGPGAEVRRPAADDD